MVCAKLTTEKMNLMVNPFQNSEYVLLNLYKTDVEDGSQEHTPDCPYLSQVCIVD